jgi:perosamine synthetase
MNLLQKLSNILLSQKRFKIYPRLQLDISFNDLINSLLSFGKRIDINESLSSIKSFYQVDKEIIPTFTVRTAFDLLLQSLQLNAGSEVLMSAINIKDMVDIIKINGLIPIPVDISLESCETSLELLEKLVSKKTKILLITHLFGTIIDLQPYVEFCQKYNLILVEDCAQAFTGSKYYGHPQADISFFSFGPIKSSTALGGGVTLLKDKTLAEKIRDIQQQYPKKTELWFFARVWKFLFLKTLSIPWIYCQLLQILQILRKDLDSTINATTRGFSQGKLLEKIRYRPPLHLIWLLAYRLSKYEDFSTRIKTAQNFLIILQKNVKHLIIPGIHAPNHSFWLFPILVAKPELLMMKLREHNFDVTRGTSSLIAYESRENYPNYLSPENAKYMMEHILFLPVSPKVTITELERLANILSRELHLQEESDCV